MPTTPGLILFRAHAGAGVGAGHVMRLLALAQRWSEEGGQALFVFPNTGGLEQRIKAEGFGWENSHQKPGSAQDAQNVLALARKHEAARVILDGYVFGADYQKSLSAHCATLLIDDFGRIGAYETDWIVDQNLGTSERHYSRRPKHTQLLLGADYVMLRREFRKWKNAARSFEAKGQYRILVTTGGEWDRSISDLVARVLKKSGLESWSVTNAQGVSDMAEVMGGADMAVSSAGTTAWELAYMGVPSLLYVAADNQKMVLKYLSDQGAAESLGDKTDLNEGKLAEVILKLVHQTEKRREMSHKGRALIDGDGTERIMTEAMMTMAQPGERR